MSSYPTRKDYRSSRRGTVRAPGSAGRPANDNSGPGKPANTNRPRGSYIPPKERPERKRPKPSRRPNRVKAPRPKVAVPRPASIAAPAGAGRLAAALRGLGALGSAFSLGYALGLIIFRSEWSGWDLAWGGNAPVTAECPVGEGPVMFGIGGSTFCGPIPEPYTPTSGHYALEFGVDNWYYYAQWPPGTIYPLNYTHGKNWQFTRFPAQGDVNGPVFTPRYAPQPQVIEDPALADAVGRAIHANPLVAPVPGIGPVVGAVAPPVVRGKLDAPAAGVGPEGYSSGEPGMARPSRPEPVRFPRKPPSRVVERKFKGGLAGRLLAARGLYGNVTELKDAVEVLHENLDKDCLKAKGARKAGPVWDPLRKPYGADGLSWKRTWNGKYVQWRREKGAYRPPTLEEMGRAVLQNLDCMDWEGAVKGLIAEAAEDRILGSLGKRSRKAAEAENGGPVPRGYELGPAL